MTSAIGAPGISVIDSCIAALLALVQKSPWFFSIGLEAKGDPVTLCSTRQTISSPSIPAVTRGIKHERAIYVQDFGSQPPCYRGALAPRPNGSKSQ